jgi:hypothetical protein
MKHTAIVIVAFLLFDIGLYVTLVMPLVASFADLGSKFTIWTVWWVYCLFSGFVAGRLA